MLLLAVVLIGNFLFLYQLSKLNRIIKTTSKGMFRIVVAQDMRKRLTLEKRHRGLYHAIKTRVDASEATAKIEDFRDNLKSETKRIKAKFGRDPSTIVEINKLTAEFVEKSDSALSFLERDSLEAAYSIIRSDSFSMLASSIKDRLGTANKRYDLRIVESDFGSAKSAIETAVLRPYYYLLFTTENELLRKEADSLAILIGDKDSIGRMLVEYTDSLRVVFEREIQTGQLDSAAWNAATRIISPPLEEILASEVEGVSQTFRESQRAVALTRTIGIWGALTLFSLGIVIAFVISRKLAAPIAKLRSAANAASRGEWDKHIPVSTNDEIGDLTDDFNAMLRDLRELDEMKTRFLASITHDLKSPIGRVRGNIANLQDGLLGPVTEGQGELLDMMGKDIEKLSRLIHDILDLQKMKAGAFKLDLREVELKEFILGVLEQHAQVLIEKGIELGVKLEIEGLRAQIDQKQLERVFDNLVGNAIKYTSAGGKIIIEAYHDGNNAVFRVIDTGVGIPKEHLTNVFDEFFQAGQKVKGVKGTGLGLTIVKQLIETHGGVIWVESEPQIGTVFAFRLPLINPR